MPTYRICNWETLFENNRSRGLTRCDWVPVPNKMDGDGYTELLDHENGPAHFGTWMAIVQVASRCQPRGTLLRATGKPHDSRSLSRISRIPYQLFEEVLSRLLEIGWIEDIEPVSVCEFKEMQEGAEKPQDDAVISHEADISRTRAGASVPFHSVPFHSVPAEEKKPVSIERKPAWKLDESYGEFVALFTEAKPNSIDEDFTRAYFDWKSLDPEQHATCKVNLRDRIDAGESIEKLPWFLSQGDWKRKRAPPRTSKGHPAKAALDKLIKEAEEQEILNK